MLSQEKLKRLNELAKLKKTSELTAEETMEQKQLREEYLSNFRGHFVDIMDHISIQDEEGNITKLQKADKTQDKYTN